MSAEYRVNQKPLKNGGKGSTITNLPYSTQIPSTCALTSVSRMNFLPLTAPNPTDNLGEVKICQHIVPEKCD